MCGYLFLKTNHCDRYLSHQVANFHSILGTQSDDFHQRSALFDSELRVFREDATWKIECPRGTVGSRLESLETLVETSKDPISASIDTSHETPAISTRCLSCNAPYQVPAQLRQQQQRPQHGRAPLNTGFELTFVKTDTADRPSTPNSAFRVDEVKPFIELHSSSLREDQINKSSSDVLDVQVGRRAGRFGVEKVRPKDIQKTPKR